MQVVFHESDFLWKLTFPGIRPVLSTSVGFYPDKL